MSMIFAHTMLSKFEVCPKQFAHLYVWKDLPKAAPTPEMTRGIEAHQAFEHRLKDGTPLPAAWAPFEPYCVTLQAQAPLVEVSLAMTEDGKPVDFWSGEAWFRGKVDVAVTKGDRAFLLDWKTGKRREEPDELETFGLLISVNFPLVEHVQGYYVWLKEGRFGRMHDASAFAQKHQQLRERAGKIDAAVHADFFPPVEGWACSYCPVSSCKFNRRRQ